MRRCGTLLIVDGDTPELTERAGRIGARPASETYGAVMRALDPSLELRVARPSWPEFDAAQVDLEEIDGVVLTGSGVAWSAHDRRAREHRRLLERVFAAGLPVIGSCFGLHLGCVVLGGSVRPSPRGVEMGVARTITLSDAGRAHPMYQGKPRAFDSVCVHRDEVERLPHGATLLASNAHSEVQAAIYEAGGVHFWGMQYHPELTLREIAHYLATPGRNSFVDPTKFASEAEAAQVIADFHRMGEDPDAHVALRWRYGVGDDAAYFDPRTRELANWLATIAAVALVEEAAHDAEPPHEAASEAALSR